MPRNSLSCVLFYALLNINSPQVNGQTSPNDLVDQMLGQFKPLIDPMKLPDESIDLEETLGVFGFQGEVRLRNGTVVGASNLMRNGDCFIDYVNTAVIIKLRMGTESTLRTTYTARYEMLGVKQDGDVTAYTGDIYFNSTIKFSPSTGAMYLMHFEIEKMDKMKVKLEDSEFLSPFVELLSEVYVRVFNKQFLWSVSHMFSGVFKEIVAGFTLPPNLRNINTSFTI